MGREEAVPPELLAQFPELRAIRLRRGGLPPRIGGWCLGRLTVDGITVGHHVWLGEQTRPSAELLLHEVRHVHQFQALPAFALRYCWESLRRGYPMNKFEIDARRYVAERLAGSNGLTPRKDG